MTTITAALGALLTCLLIAPPAVAVAPDDDQVVYYDLGEATVEPEYLHTAFNSSPVMVVEHWKHWGDAVAVGRGHWDSSCASCPPPRRRRAVVRLSRLQTCADDDTVGYSKAVVIVAKPDRGHTRTRYSLPTFCPAGD